MIELSPGWGFAANTFLRRAGDEVEEMLGLGSAAEDAGFDSLWIGDHILWHTPIVDGLTLLSAFAGTTRRISLGTAIFLLGLRPPAIGVKTGTSQQAAQSQASEFLAHVYAMGGEPLMRYAIAGEPRECAGRLAESIDAGVEHFVLRPAAWEQREQLGGWAEHLLPLLPSLRTGAQPPRDPVA